MYFVNKTLFAVYCSKYSWCCAVCIRSSANLTL